MSAHAMTVPASTAPQASSPAAASAAAPSTASPAPVQGQGGAQPQANPGGAQSGGSAAGDQQQQQQPSPDDKFRRLAKRNVELERRVKELTPKAARADEYEPIVTGLKDPSKRWEILEKQGVSYSEWTEHLLKNGGNADAAAKSLDLPPEVQAKLKKLDEIEGKLSEREKAEAADAERKQLGAARAYVQKVVESSGDKYVLIGALGQHDAVINEYRKQQQELGDEVDEQAVMASVEQRIETTVTTQLQKIAGTPKGKALLQKILDALAAPQTGGDTTPSADNANPQAKQGPQLGRRKTLTNDVSAQPGDGVDLTQLTPAEKRQRALAKAKKATSAA